MIQVVCDLCKKELKKPGALYFSSPKRGKVKKKHICTKCEKRFQKLFAGRAS